MTFWAILIGFLGMLGIAVALNPLRALALAKDIGAFVLDKGRAAAAWARDPARNWWKVGCVSLGATCALLSWYADAQRREVVLVTQTLTAEVETEKTRAAGAIDAATSNFNALLQCKALLAIEVGQRQETERLNAAAVAAAERVATKARADLAEFKRRQKTPSCAAALTELEAACSDFSDF